MPKYDLRRLCWLALALAGCRGPGVPPPAPSPPLVTVSRPLQEEVTDYRHFTGRMEAVETAEVRARVRGFLQAVHFREGTEVRKGEILYEIDPRTFQAELERAQAEVKRLEPQFQLAATEAERAERLRGTGAVSQEEYVQRVTAREAGRAALQQARAAAESARLELEFTTVRAPIDGRIGRTLVTEGNLVGSNEPTLLTTIVRVDPVYVFFEAAERDFLEYQRLIREQGAAAAAEAKVPVHVGLAAQDGYPHRGVLNFRDNRVDPGTGTILLRGELPNPDRLLVPGLFARVRVPVGGPRPRLLVPEVALSADQRGPYLLVVGPDDRVARRAVRPGASLEGRAVIEEGLASDDWVIVNGLQRARPGTKVEPVRESGAAASGAPQAGTPPGRGAPPFATASPPGSGKP